MRVRREWWTQGRAKQTSLYGRESGWWWWVEGHTIDGYRISAVGRTRHEAELAGLCERTLGRGCKIPAHKKREWRFRR